MRRQDRSIEGIEALAGVLGRCDVARLAIATGGAPYIVPLCLAHELEGGKLRLYFHSAREGRKVELLREHPLVGFEADCSVQIVRGGAPCQWTARYESVIGTGEVVALESRGEKARAMDLIMRKHGCEGPLNYPDAALNAALLLRLDVLTITGKRNMG